MSTAFISQTSVDSRPVARCKIHSTELDACKLMCVCIGVADKNFFRILLLVSSLNQNKVKHDTVIKPCSRLDYHVLLCFGSEIP